MNEALWMCSIQRLSAFVDCINYFRVPLFYCCPLNTSFFKYIAIILRYSDYRRYWAFVIRNESIAIILNFTPVPRDDYRIPVAAPGVYREIFNSDAQQYGGSGVVNQGDLHTEAVPFNGREHSLRFTLPPLSGVVLRYQS